jgi:hypothetical protein
MKATALEIDDSIARLIKTAVGGANDTLTIVNTLISTQAQTLASQQTLLGEANSSIARLSTENADLRAASLERDRIMRTLEVELERIRLADGRKGEVIALARQLGGGVLHHMSTRALPAPANNEPSEPLSIRDLASRLVASLRPETVVAVRQDAGDELVGTLLRALASEEG